jgi:hypothetical protein
MNRKRDLKHLDARLRAERLAPPSQLMSAIAARAPERTSRRPRVSLRVALAGGLTAALLVPLAAWGGVGYGASQVSSAVSAVKSTLVGKGPPNTAASAHHQYGFPPVIKALAPSKACPRQVIMIIGKNFEGGQPDEVTSVAFNGVAASFLVNGDKLIYARVPTSATDGPVTVTNPFGTAISKKIFRVKTGRKCLGFIKHTPQFPTK